MADESKHVSIDERGVAEFSKNFHHGNISHWLSGAPFGFTDLSEEEKLNFLLVFNSISFSYWGNPKWVIEYKGKQHDGSWAMITCLHRALDEGVPILDTEYRARITKEEMANILRGNIEIPLLEERWKITKDIGKTLIEKFGGNFANLVKKAGGATKLLDLVLENFSSFDDSSTYGGWSVFFYKRAQLLILDIYQFFGGKGYGGLSDIDQLTACADYKLPQVLRKLGILKYSKELAKKVDNKIEIAKNSKEEIEIRSNTIWAVELIRQELLNIGQEVMPIGINDHLWLMSQNKLPDDRPYHLTRTTAY